MLGWFMELILDLIAFLLGDKIPYERRAHHIATARLYGSIAIIFIGGLVGVLLILDIGGRLDEPTRTTFTTIVGLAYLSVLVGVLLTYVRRVRRRRR